MRRSFFACRLSLIGTFLCVSMALLAHVAFAKTAYVVRVEDANCVAVSDTKGSSEISGRYFLYGIQVPTGNQPFASQALSYLSQLLPPGTRINVDDKGEDEQKLSRALIQVSGSSVNYMLLKKGLAWVDRKRCLALYCRRWYVQEHYAVTDRVGIWSLDLGTPPWQWSTPK